MNERVEYRGDWWVPGSERRWPGTFTFTPEAGAKLKVDADHGELPDQPSPEETPVIHGLSMNGKALTLVDSAHVTSKLHLPGRLEATFAPFYTLIGAWFNRDELRFEQLRFRTTDLDAWAGASGFAVKSLERGYSVQYEVPDSMPLGATPSASFSVEFSGPGLTLTNPLVELDMRQRARVQITCKEPLPLEELLDLVHQTRNFLSFVVRRRVELLEITTRADVEVTRRSGVEMERLPITILYKTMLEPSRGESVERRKMLFRPEDHAESHLPLGRWFDKSDLLRPITDLYLVGLYQPSTYLELQFISLAQALESLHSRKFPNYELPKREHKVRLDEILASAPDGQRDWLKGKLAMSNKASFRQGIGELVQTLPPSLKNRIGDIDRFTAVVGWTRNYFVHWNPDNQKRAAKGQDLVRLTESLRLILESLLLIELDFTLDEIERLIEENWSVKRDLEFAFKDLW